MNNTTVFEKLKYPNGKRSVEWFHTHFDLCLAIIKNKGYGDREAVRLCWNVFEDTDWKNYPDCMTVEQKSQMILSKEDYDKQCCESMLAAMEKEPEGNCNRHYLITVDSPDKVAVAKCLIELGLRPCDVNAGYDSDDPNVMVSGSTRFDIYGYYEEEVARILSERLNCLVFTEDAWDNSGCAVFLDGEPAEFGDEYLAEVSLCRCADSDCFDVNFIVKRPDSTAFAWGGGGSVYFDSLNAYLGNLGFDREAFNKEYGYVTLSAKNRRKVV